MYDGIWCVEYYRWLVVNDVRSMDNDIRTMHYNWFSVDNHIRPVDNQRWSVVYFRSLMVDQVRSVNDHVVLLASLCFLLGLVLFFCFRLLRVRFVFFVVIWFVCVRC